MLKKLIRYDFNSVFKLWWIAALSTVVLSLIGGGIGNFLAADSFTEKVIPPAILVIAVIIMVMVYLGFVAFGIFSSILVYLRFYKNLYTDEGYLTFTLPVKRQSILNSKVFLGFVTTILTYLVLGFNSIVVLLVSCGKYIFTKEFYKEFMIVVNDILKYKYNYYFIIYLIEALVIFALMSLVSLLFAYACITVASIIAKKAKILVAVGIYYGATTILSSILSIFYLFGITSFVSVFSKLPENTILVCIALLLLIIILTLCAVCCMLYYTTHWSLHKKLNLA